MFGLKTQRKSHIYFVDFIMIEDPFYTRNNDEIWGEKMKSKVYWQLHNSLISTSHKFRSEEKCEKCEKGKWSGRKSEMAWKIEWKIAWKISRSLNISI